MERRAFDVAVVGLGAMGSAAAWRLARRGARVLGLDRYAPPHHRGSSHGHTRIIREAYHEHPLYVPLVRRARTLWEELAAEAGTTLLQRTGGLIVGPLDGELVPGATLSAGRYSLPHEAWSAADIRARVPVMRVPDHIAGLFEPNAGVLFAERCIDAMLDEAARHGAHLLRDTTVTGWTRAGDHIAVATAAHDYHASRVILTAGPWLPGLLGSMVLPLWLERAVQFWFQPAASAALFDASRFPVFLLEYARGRVFYGVPDFEHGIKVAFHHHGEPATADGMPRRVGDEETRAVRRMLERWIPDAAGPLRDASVCIYTNTPDGHFVIDRHAQVPEVLVASCCSGHGFKFAPAVGDLLADLAAGVQPAFDILPFRAGRFA